MASTKRARAKSSRKVSTSAARSSRKAVDLKGIREEIKNQVGNAATGMVASGIEEANKGHYAAMKFLFELIGLYPVPDGIQEVESEDGLAKTLFKRLGIADQTPEVTNDTPHSSTPAPDAVE